MKRFVFWVMVAVCVMMGVEPVFAASKSKRDIFTLMDSVEKLANQIAQHNKPVFETHLTRKEREYYDMGDDDPSISRIVWNRVYAKDKTVVVGIAEKNKRFFALYFKTTDPAFSFAGGIRVGASIKDLESFLGYSITKKTIPENTVYAKKGNNIFFAGPINLESDAEEPIILIKFENGRISEIFYDITSGRGTTEVFSSQKALSYADQQARKMGLSQFDTAMYWSIFDNQ